MGIFLVAGAVFFEVIADILLKKWALGNKTLFLGIALILYFVGTLIWAYSLKFEFLSKAIIIFTILNLVAIVIAGVVFFKEDLSLVNKIGILLGIVSVILIQL